MPKLGKSLTRALGVIKQAVVKPAQSEATKVTEAVREPAKKVVGWVAREAQRQVAQSQETFGKSHIGNWSGAGSGQNVGWLQKQPPPTTSHV